MYIPGESRTDPVTGTCWRYIGHGWWATSEDGQAGLSHEAGPVLTHKRALSCEPDLTDLTTALVEAHRQGWRVWPPKEVGDVWGVDGDRHFYVGGTLQDAVAKAKAGKGDPYVLPMDAPPETIQQAVARVQVEGVDFSPLFGGGEKHKQP